MLRKLPFLVLLLLILMASAALAAPPKETTPEYMIQDVETATSDPTRGIYTIYAGMPLDEFKANGGGIPGWITIQENHRDTTYKNGYRVNIDNYRLGKTPKPPYVVIVACHFEDDHLQNGQVSFNFDNKADSDTVYQIAKKNFIRAWGAPELIIRHETGGETDVWRDKERNNIQEIGHAGPHNRLKEFKGKPPKGSIRSKIKEPSNPVDALYYRARYSVNISSEPYGTEKWEALRRLAVESQKKYHDRKMK